jgi:hypothetical protein
MQSRTLHFGQGYSVVCAPSLIASALSFKYCSFAAAFVALTLSEARSYCNPTHRKVAATN